MNFRISRERVFRKIFDFLTGHKFYGRFSEAKEGKDGKYVPVYEKFYVPVQPE